MERPIEVIARDGDAGDQEPGALVVDGERLDVLGIDDRWYEPEARYFKVAASDGRIYLLRCSAEDMRWTVVQIWALDA